MKSAYLLLAIVGAALPYAFFVGFLAQHGLDVRLMMHELFANAISTFFAVDFLISCVVFAVYLRREARRLAMRGWWVYLVVLLTVGLSCALPLFLYARESALTTKRPA